MQYFLKWRTFTTTTCLIGVCCPSVRADIDIPIIENTELSLGGRLVVQYYNSEIDDGEQRETESDTEIRRFRPDLKAKWGDWRAKLAWEFSHRNPNTVKDAYIEYRGFDNFRLKLGNETAPFSRERMTSSRTQQLPERSNIGENNWGTPTRVVGLHLETDVSDQWQAFASLARSDVYSDGHTEIRFLSPWRKHDLNGAETNSGTIFSSRFDLHFNNGADYKQSQLKEKSGATISLAGFYWIGDEDKPTSYDYYEDVYGIEFSVANRYRAFSFDFQTQKTIANVNADGYSDEIKTIIGFDNPSITRGIVADNQAELTHVNIDAGYMLIAKRCEIALGLGVLQAGSKGEVPTFATSDVWQKKWSYSEIGVNIFFDGHNNKLTTSLRKDRHIEGENENAETLTVQWQIAF